MTPDQVTRVSPQETRRRVETGQALLVCGYEGDKFDRNRRGVRRSRRSPAGSDEGFIDVTALDGGVEAWKEAGFPVC